MMQLGIFAKTFTGGDPQTVLVAARQAGFKSVQYNMACSGLSSLPAAITDEQALAVAQAAQVNPVPPALATCLGASLAFMLPVSTPPNAIVFGTGCVPLLKMVKHGFALDLIGIGAIIIVVHWLVPLLLGA